MRKGNKGLALAASVAVFMGSTGTAAFAGKKMGQKHGSAEAYAIGEDTATSSDAEKIYYMEEEVPAEDGEALLGDAALDTTEALGRPAGAAGTGISLLSDDGPEMDGSVRIRIGDSEEDVPYSMEGFRADPRMVEGLLPPVLEGRDGERYVLDYVRADGAPYEYFFLANKRMYADRFYAQAAITSNNCVYDAFAEGAYPVEAAYGLDADGDGIADLHQAAYIYEASQGGTLEGGAGQHKEAFISGSSVLVPGLGWTTYYVSSGRMNFRDSGTPVADEGYVFSHWSITDKDGASQGDIPPDIPLIWYSMQCQGGDVYTVTAVFVPDETEPEETMPEETTLEETSPEETSPAETQPEETTPEGTSPEEISPSESVPEETS
ncbi:MAG: hypothetical protein NC489_36230, partial [Ruminococcus flavefaciens]|nr:hypothetical protein [Ruminococcus flavefaciens]